MTCRDFSMHTRLNTDSNWIQKLSFYVCFVCCLFPRSLLNILLSLLYHNAFPREPWENILHSLSRERKSYSLSVSLKHVENLKRFSFVDSILRWQTNLRQIDLSDKLTFTGTKIRSQWIVLKCLDNSFFNSVPRLCWSKG